MPTYDYKCRACGHTFEELQSFSAPVLTKCPACKKNQLERLFGGGGAIIFKGSGFYETDYRRTGGNKNGAAKADAPAEAGAAKPETKADSTASGTGTGSASSGEGASGGKSGGAGGKKKAT